MRAAEMRHFDLSDGDFEGWRKIPHARRFIHHFTSLGALQIRLVKMKSGWPSRFRLRKEGALRWHCKCIHRN